MRLLPKTNPGFANHNGGGEGGALAAIIGMRRRTKRAHVVAVTMLLDLVQDERRQRGVDVEPPGDAHIRDVAFLDVVLELGDLVDVAQLLHAAGRLGDVWEINRLTVAAPSHRWRRSRP